MLQWWCADQDPHERGYSLFGNLSTLPDYNICDLHHSVMICRSLWRLSWEGLFPFWDLLYTVWLQYPFSTLPDYNIHDLHYSVMICRSLWRPSQERLFPFQNSLYTVWIQYLWLASLSDGMQIFVKTLMEKTILFSGIFLLCLTIISVTYITQWWYADLGEDPHEKDHSHFGIHCTVSDYNICDLHHLVIMCRFL